MIIIMTMFQKSQESAMIGKDNPGYDASSSEEDGGMTMMG